MKTNIGIVDRSVRMLAAIVIVALFFTKVISGTLAVVLMVLAAVLFFTAFFRFCPLYKIFGVNTWNKK